MALQAWLTRLPGLSLRRGASTWLRFSPSGRSTRLQRLPRGVSGLDRDHEPQHHDPASTWLAWTLTRSRASIFRIGPRDQIVRTRADACGRYKGVSFRGKPRRTLFFRAGRFTPCTASIPAAAMQTALEIADTWLPTSQYRRGLCSPLVGTGEGLLPTSRYRRGSAPDQSVPAVRCKTKYLARTRAARTQKCA